MVGGSFVTMEITDTRRAPGAPEVLMELGGLTV